MGDYLPTTNLVDLERIAIRLALEEARGNKKKAAKALGISRSALYAKAYRLGLLEHPRPASLTEEAPPS